jgi:phage terminase large subunit-like protein
VPRKNGKSEMAAGVALYLAIADGEPGAEVYSSATKRDQARIVFDAAKAMVRQNPELREHVTSHRNNMSVARMQTKFEPLSAEGDTLDGLNPHGNIVDELHAHKSRLVWDVLATAMGARRQPLTLAITTAGVYDPTSIGWELHEYAQQVLEGVFTDESFFAFIAAMDEGDDWRDPEIWLKANPNLGVSVKWDSIEELCERAKRTPSFLNTFLRLHGNLWTQQVTRWLSIEDWRAAPDRADEADLIGRRCWGGLDLSSRLDFTAFALVFPDTDGYYDLLMRLWIPEDRLRERALRHSDFAAWAQEGWIRTTPGDVIDYDFITRQILEDAEWFDIAELAYDPWNATQTALTLADSELTMVEFRQGYKSMSEPCKELEKLVVSKRLRHGDNPALTWMANNVAVTEDPSGNIKMAKDKSAEKIDGMVATAMALGRAIIHEDEGPSVYASRGLRSV